MGDSEANDTVSILYWRKPCYDMFNCPVSYDSRKRHMAIFKSDHAKSSLFGV